MIAGRVVPVRASALLESPAAVGFFRRSIVVPAGLASVLSNREMDAIVLHELTQVRRFDNVIEFLHAVVCCVFWFHPLVWIVGVRLRQARELAADEPVIAAPPASRVRAATTSSSSVLVCQAACTDKRTAAGGRVCGDTCTGGKQRFASHFLASTTGAPPS